MQNTNYNPFLCKKIIKLAAKMLIIKAHSYDLYDKNSYDGNNYDEIHHFAIIHCLDVVNMATMIVCNKYNIIPYYSGKVTSRMRNRAFRLAYPNMCAMFKRERTCNETMARYIINQFGNSNEE